MNYNNDNIELHKSKIQRHFSIEERKIISNMLRAKKYTLADISTVLSRTKGAVYKEIVRNGELKPYSSRIKRKNSLRFYKNYNYVATKAHNKYLKTFISPKYLTSFLFCIEWINNNIEYDRSMYEMRELFIQSNPNSPVPCESTLYYYWKKNIIKYSNQRKPRKKKANGSKTLKDSNKISIEERPDVINKKLRFGDWEIDLVIDGDKKGGLITFNERCSINLYTKKINNKKAITVFRAIQELIEEIGIKNIKSITSDNGTEFAYHLRITNLYGIKWYFCHPFCSGERGLNEHLNGEIRFYYPKGTPFNDKTQSEIDKIISRINNKIRKSLGGKTASEVYNYHLNNNR